MVKISMEVVKQCCEAQPTKLEALNCENVFMQAAFELVSPKDDWKGPIDAVVQDDVCQFTPDVVAYAIAYMTATEAKIVPQEGAHRFIADGYRKGPAA